VAQQLEQRTADQVAEVGLAPGVEVVHAQHVIAALEQAAAQMRADEACATGNQHPFAAFHRAPLAVCYARTRRPGVAKRARASVAQHRRARKPDSTMG
jgi:hypothetical protein